MNTFQTLKNVPLIRTTVILMLTAPTPKDHFTARVTMVTLEMELCALVISFLRPFNSVIN